MSRSLTFTFTLLSFTLLSFGCGKEPSHKIDGPKGTVRGKVELDGKPISGGAHINFTHQKLGLVASSPVTADGSYSLEMLDTMQIPVGIYKVAVTPPAVPAMSPEEAMKLNVEGKLNDTASPIPAKYLRTDESPIKYEVKEGENKYTVELKSGT